MDKNIKEIELNSFEEFEQIVKEQICQNKFEQVTNIISKPTDVLFRGHADSTWKLESTLVRDSDIKVYSEEKYHNEIASLVKKIYEYTGKEWCVPQYINKPYIEDGHRNIFDHPLAYDFIVYLRHFGFPSPLLDWTENPYIAAYFAYSDNVNANKVAIYIYKQSNDNSMVSEDKSTVIHLGKHLNTHARHSLQQAQYTVCKSTQVDKDCDEFKQNFFYDSYEDYNWNSNDLDDGNIRNQCIKYILPASQKDDILKTLESKYITKLLLMQNEDFKTKSEEELIKGLKDEFLKKF
ncbi:FRG domain-containing protein [Sulfurovum sp. ST-21]|uniref:FRG domain-containing protein n=1 Tax=Sulfurovum indicum TaxID=2779528 RepID=A0A7M1S6D7_9BACT|nr:FRG domain-containing protein [Sulfurovum indicum]QOR62928.1 FRG domain-containing protein [Sulfurovum indicum]